MRISGIFILFFITLSGYSQNEFIISGKIKDGVTNEPLPGANVFITNTTNGVTTNEFGYFKLYVNRGLNSLSVSYLGYKPFETVLNITTDTSKVQINLTPLAYSGNTITVTADLGTQKISNTETDVIQLTSRDIKHLPALMGETDFLRIIQLKPGVQAANDANMGFYVRGGGADQNLILMDNIPVYNPSHVMGFFSIFNTDVIHSAKLIKSGMPASYGGRISSITDIKTKVPDLSKYTIKGNIGLLSSKISIEGPILKDKTSFFISTRKTYLDELIKPVIKLFLKEKTSFVHYSKYHFYDINVKFYWKINTKHSINVSGYLGQDFYSLQKLELDFTNQMKWGNKLISTIWNYQINKNWNIKTTGGFTNYSYNLDANQKNIYIGMLSNIEDYVFKSDITYASQTGSIIKFGLEYNNHNFRPNNLDAVANYLSLQFGANRLLKAHESALYYNQEFDLSPGLRISYGLRGIYYLHIGPYYELIENETGQVSDSIYYSYNKGIKPYFAAEPRLNIRYQFNTESSIKAAFTYNSQNIHMVSPSSVTLPTDVWLPSTKKVKPQKGYQLTGGYYRNFMKNKYNTPLSIYYKKYENQIELLYGIINNFEDNNFEESMTFGRGFSYGSELYLQKKWGDLSGWLSYTLSFSFREFDEINNGEIYPAKYDRRHDLNLVLCYNLSEKLTLSGTFIFASGNAYTVPEYKYIIEGNIISGTEYVNSFRMPAYHRLDLSLNYIHKKTENFESVWNISVFNVYNRANPFYIYFETEGNISEYNLSITPKQITVFPILPSISWLFKF